MPYLINKRPEPEPIYSKILTAALKLFVGNGFHRVSVHEIQQLANVSIGSIYKYFNGKEGIAEALYLHVLDEIEQLVDGVLETDQSAREQCESLITKFFFHTENDAEIIAYVFNAKHSEFLPHLAPICDAAPFVKMQSIVQQGMDQGEFKEMDSRIATTIIFGSMTRLIQQRLEGVITHPLPEYSEQLLQTILSGIGTPSLAQTNTQSTIAQKTVKLV